MSHVCSSPARMGVFEASLESCLSKNSRMGAPWSSTDVQLKEIMPEWKVAFFRAHHEAVSGSVSTDEDELLACTHPISQEEK